MNIIGIAGFARCGKDTFYAIATNILKYNNYNCQRAAFADFLKEEINEMLLDNNFAYDVYTNDTAEKSKLRPLMVWWGMSRRNDTNGKYWIKSVEKYLDNLKKNHYTNNADNFCVFIPDVRFKNEVEWIKDMNHGYVIHLRKYSLLSKLDLKEYDLAPNEEEEKNDPIVQKLANVKIEWENKNNFDLLNDESLRKIVLDALNSLAVFNGKLK